MSTPPGIPHVVVVGAGIAGLAAAAALREQATAGLRVTVLEGSAAIGGKLALTEVGGVVTDSGAESMLARRPEAVALAESAGLAADVVHPATAGAGVWSRGALRTLPSGQLMGVPADLRALAASGTISARGLARVPLDHVLPRTPVAGDVSIGRYVSARLGREVVDRLVEPLLGGVYAGHADELSLDATLPQLSGVVRSERSLLRGVRQVLGAASTAASGPVFASLRGGLGRLPAAVATASGADIRTSAMVRELRRSPGGWRVVVGSTRDAETLFADAVVLALPAAAGRAAAARAGAPRRRRPRRDRLRERRDRDLRLPLGGPGGSAVRYRLPRTSRRAQGHQGGDVLVSEVGVARCRGDLAIVRTSVGRHREVVDLQRDDGELAGVALDDLSEALGVTVRPVDAVVTRWGGALPQYAVGHLDRVARIRRAVAELPGLAVCGAAYDGVGIPACIASGTPLRPGSSHPSPNGDNGFMADIAPPSGDRPKARDINEMVRYTMWSVFRVARPFGDSGRDSVVAEVESLVDQLAAKDVVVRGCYDVAGLRADADFMVWWHAESSDALQDAYSSLRRTTLGRACEPVWSVMALHRPAEFNKSHVPAFLADEEPRDYVCVYPFVRSYEWYLLPDEERRGDAGRARADGARLPRRARQHRGVVRARRLRVDPRLRGRRAAPHRRPDAAPARRPRPGGTCARRCPFYTGRRRPVADLVAALPCSDRWRRTGACRIPAGQPSARSPRWCAPISTRAEREGSSCRSLVGAEAGGSTGDTAAYQARSASAPGPCWTGAVAEPGGVKRPRVVRHQIDRRRGARARAGCRAGLRPGGPLTALSSSG